MYRDLTGHDEKRNDINVEIMRGNLLLEVCTRKIITSVSHK